MRCSGKIYWDRNGRLLSGSQCSSLPVLLWQKYSLAFFRPRNRASVLKFCAMPKPSPIQPLFLSGQSLFQAVADWHCIATPKVSLGPALRIPEAARPYMAAMERECVKAGMNVCQGGGGKRETESLPLLSLDYIILDLVKSWCRVLPLTNPFSRSSRILCSVSNPFPRLGSIPYDHLLDSYCVCAYPPVPHPCAILVSYWACAEEKFPFIVLIVYSSLPQSAQVGQWQPGEIGKLVVSPKTGDKEC